MTYGRIKEPTTEREKALAAILVPDDVLSEMTKLKEFLGDLPPNQSPVNLMERIYTVADQYMERAIVPHLSCKNKCSHCCHVPVESTLLESLYIFAKTGRNLHVGKNPNKAKLCPFLESDSCSIYAHRPLVCRLFGSFEEAQKCKDPNNVHLVHSIQTSDFWMLGVYGGVVENSFAMSNHPECVFEPYKDIRDWFK